MSCQKVSLLVPSTYRLLTMNGQEWKTVADLPPTSMCWDGADFCPVQIEPLPNKSLSTHFVMVDAVTTVAEDAERCPLERVNVQTRWMPPWLSVHGTDKEVPRKKERCTAKHHALLALTDFLNTRQCRYSLGHVECLLPSSRYRQLEALGYIPEMRENSPQVSRFTPLLISKKDVSVGCESSQTELCREHALVYINTVLAVKGTLQKDKGGLVEVRDNGMRMKAEAYRRLRRLLTLCAVPNRRSPKVFATRNGKNRPPKRKMMLALHHNIVAVHTLPVKENTRDREDFYRQLQTRPKFSQHTAKMTFRQMTTTCNWFRITVTTSDSLAIEGVIVTIIRKKINK